MDLKEYVKSNVACQLEGDSLPFPTHTISVEKNAILSPYGKIEDKVFFISEGIVEVIVETNGEERIIDFFFDNSCFSAYTSFITQTPSDILTRSITACKLEYVKHQDLIASYNHSLGANQIGRQLTEVIYVMRMQREKDFLTKTAEERYAELLTNRPELIKQIPSNKIARYLGIHPESLSRIRKKIIS